MSPFGHACHDHTPLDAAQGSFGRRLPVLRAEPVHHSQAPIHISQTIDTNLNIFTERRRCQMDSSSLLVSAAVMRQALDTGSDVVALKTVSQARELAEQFGEQAKAKAAGGDGIGVDIDVSA